MSDEEPNSDRMGYDAHPVFDKIEDGDEGHWIPDVDHSIFPVEIEMIYGRSRVDRVVLHNSTFKNGLELTPEKFVKYVENHVDEGSYPHVSLEDEDKEMEVIT